MLRRAFTLAILAAVALAPSACENEHEGDVRVVAIGGTPKVRDPAAGPITPGDAVLLQNVAQGLVRLDANGQIVPGLAERWNVSDDGLSYIFRIATTTWADKRKVSAHQVARSLRRSIAQSSNNPLKDTLGAVTNIVAMTDRVIEIELRAPRPNLLALLAQPEFAVLRGGVGSGPFEISDRPGPEGEIRLRREVGAPDGEEGRSDVVLLSAAPAEAAVRAFAGRKADLVVGGTYLDLPYARAARLPRNSLRFDPASGLFGLVPTLAGGTLADPDVRRLLSQAIDRGALVTALRVPGLAARATVLEPGLDGVPPPVTPAWAATPIADRRPALAAEAARLCGDERPTIRIALPEAPGADILLAALARDWGALGLKVERVKTVRAADLRLIDQVAPSSAPAWFLRQFRCGVVAVCDEETDKLLDAARETPVPAQRYAFLAEAARRIDDAQLFFPLTAPIRWSLVSPRIEGFAGNRYARHTLTDLQQRPGGGG